MVSLLGTKVGLPVSGRQCLSLVLAETLPPQFTPRSKQYAIKTIWFHEHIVLRRIRRFKIDTVEQLGDMFTKGLPRTTFEYSRKNLLGC
eukprot:CCRYP_001398-RA/>CCRYP_001398-RA protein AED:0.41 eAED:0.41 QI:0/-1/0/1/-1/0/1/0/88